MSSKNITMTEGSLGKNILLFSLPLMFSNLLQVLFNMADIAVVGQFAGSSALGSVGSTATLMLLYTGFLIGIGSGINVVTARCCGSGDREGLGKAIHTSAILSFLIGLVLLVIGEVSARFLLTLLNTKESLMEGAVLYMQICFIGLPALAIYNFGNAVFSAVGNTKKPLFFLSVAGILNVLLNLLFVIVFRMGVAGVAVSTVISQYTSATLIVISLARAGKEPHGLRFRSLHIDPSKAKPILVMGLSAGLQNAIFYVANLFVQSAVNSFDTVMVEGNSAAANADALVYDVMAAFYTACSSFMSQNFGAGNRKRVLRSFYISLAYSLISGCLLGFSLVLFGRQFLGLFTSDSEVIEAGMMRLTIMGLSYGFSAFMDSGIAASRGIGKTVWPTFIVIMGSCVFRIIWIYTIFAHFHTIESLYLLFICSWAVTATFELIYFAHAYRRQMALFETSSPAGRP